MKPALLILDMVKQSFSESFRGGILHKGKDEQVRVINDLAKYFRSRGFPIYWIIQKYRSDLSDAPLLMRKKKEMKFIEGTAGCELLDELQYRKGEPIIVKKRYSAFFGTNLQKRLQHDNIDSLVVAGINTHACIRQTSIDAYCHDYAVIWPQGGVNSSLPEYGDNTIKYMAGGLVEIMSIQEIKILIG